ncbi:hypothetical protein ANCCEY_11859 [Ancylostoma ceylanicum]|uniref:SCP domain-containing protein n=1 Tax=Ancylostoma ceylanicum TaxID=53326 RepID=A0A0D6LN25_9BILA|nr:hypothetical protein ANCCEY_11859 [Ancylostoma ceylanicum]
MGQQWDLFKPIRRICQNSSFDADIIDVNVIGEINDKRYEVLRGLVINGPWQGKDKWTPETQGYGKKLPKAKTMNNLVYDCELEKEAKTLLDPKCTDVEPTAPTGKTGIFYSKDMDWDVPDITSAVTEWMEEISEFAVSDIAITDKEVTFKDNALREYLNLMRPNLTKIGCAEVLCNDKGMSKYRAFCLTDQSPLKLDDVVYEAGNGGCKEGEQCPQGSCDQFGMCDVKP